MFGGGCATGSPSCSAVRGSQKQCLVGVCHWLSLMQCSEGEPETMFGGGVPLAFPNPYLAPDQNQILIALTIAIENSV